MGQPVFQRIRSDPTRSHNQPLLLNYPQNTNSEQAQLRMRRRERAIHFCRATPRLQLCAARLTSRAAGGTADEPQPWERHRFEALCELIPKRRAHELARGVTEELQECTVAL